MKSKGFIIQAGIIILSLLVIFALTGCGNNSNNTNQVIKYSVAGTVLDGEGTHITDVSLAIKGNEIQDSSVEVDEKGMWTAVDLQGEVTITPVKDDWTFTPPEVIVSEKDDGKNDINFTGQEIIYPDVKTLTPEENMTDVEPDVVVTVEFNQDVTEVYLAGITITDSGANPVGGVTASLSGRNLTINHADFNFNTEYIVTIPVNTVENSNSVRNKEISWNFTTRDTLAPPGFNNLTPTDNSTDVELAVAVSVEFGQDIIEEELSGISITTDGGSTMVTGVSASLSSRTITITHDDFDYNKTYSVTVPAGAVTNTDGIGNDEISWGFTTRDSIAPPTVSNLFPVENSTDIALNTNISVLFDKQIITGDLNGISIIDDNYNQVTGVTAFVSGRTLVINHDDLDYFRTYTVTIPPGTVTNTDGIGNDEVSWSFTTIAAYIFEESWGSQGSEEGEFIAPSDIAVDQTLNIYVADTGNNRIQQFTNTGEVYIWDGFWAPDGIAVDSDSNVYVVDTNYHRVRVLDFSGNLVAAWGERGNGDGQFEYPRGIAVDSFGDVFVADTSNYRIQTFFNGAYISQWGEEGTGDTQFKELQEVAVDSYNNVYVVDGYNHRVQKFSVSGIFITAWGSYGSRYGELNYPRGIAVDKYNNVYVADTYNNRIQKFDSNGNLITAWGSYGSGAGQFNHPEGIAVDDYDNVYVADTLNHRIQKFRPW